MVQQHEWHTIILLSDAIAALSSATVPAYICVHQTTYMLSRLQPVSRPYLAVLQPLRNAFCMVAVFAIQHTHFVIPIKLHATHRAPASVCTSSHACIYQAAAVILNWSISPMLLFVHLLDKCRLSTCTNLVLRTKHNNMDIRTHRQCASVRMQDCRVTAGEASFCGHDAPVLS